LLIKICKNTILSKFKIRKFIVTAALPVTLVVGVGEAVVKAVVVVVDGF